MSKRKYPPLLRHSILTDQVYVVTRYTKKESHIVAHEKWDVTEEFNALCDNYIKKMQKEELK